MVSLSGILLVSALLRPGAPEAVGESWSFITRRDEEFVGPDKRLEEALARRCAPSSTMLADLAALENSTRAIPASPVLPAPFRRYETGANLNDTRRTDFSDYQPERIKQRILKFQQMLILLAQERMQDVKHLMREHEQDERFRMASIFSKLDEWLEQMRQMFKSTTLHTVYRPNRKHLLYYSLLLRKNIDITYTVEFFLHAHTVFTLLTTNPKPK